MFRETLQAIIAKRDLSEAEMAEMIGEILAGEATDARIGAFMGALATKGETFEELAGAARAMRRKAHRIQTPAGTVVDTCGTGGDGAKTFNISTTTAFVVAGCGVTVAKHGNRSVSSKCGSADVLETLGVKLDTAPEVVEEAICGRSASAFCSRRSITAPCATRRRPGRRWASAASSTCWGRSPTRPAPTASFWASTRRPLTEMFARALQMLGTRRALVVHGHDGLDEISVCAPTRISELRRPGAHLRPGSPSIFRRRLADPADLAGGEPAENAEITRKILDGEAGPRRNVTLLNAAAALVAAGKAASLADGLVLAESALDSGAAAAKLEALVRFTRENG
jgi:anthranilate phosphoribosyltransferase